MEHMNTGGHSFSVPFMSLAAATTGHIAVRMPLKGHTLRLFPASAYKHLCSCLFYSVVSRLFRLRGNAFWKSFRNLFSSRTPHSSSPHFARLQMEAIVVHPSQRVFTKTAKTKCRKLCAKNNRDVLAHSSTG